MSKHWRWFVPGHIWLLPFTIGYALFAFFAYRARSWGFRNGVLVCIGGQHEDGSTRILGKPGAQTIGAAQAYSDSRQIGRVDLHVHENGHTVQQMCAALIGQLVVPLVAVALGWNALWACALGGFIGAAAYAVLYGVFFVVPWIASGFGPWHDAYEKNPFEAQCYRRQAAFLQMNAEQRARVWT